MHEPARLRVGEKGDGCIVHAYHCECSMPPKEVESMTGLHIAHPETKCRTIADRGWSLKTQAFRSWVSLNEFQASRCLNLKGLRHAHTHRMQDALRVDMQTCKHNRICQVERGSQAAAETAARFRTRALRNLSKPWRSKSFSSCTKRESLVPLN